MRKKRIKCRIMLLQTMEANQNEESPDKDTSTMECRVTGENRGSSEGLRTKL